MRRRRSALLAVGAVAAMLLSAVPAPAAVPVAPAPAGVLDTAVARATGQVSVVVVRRPGSGTAAERAVQRLGGTVTTPLPIINGFAARLDAADAAALARDGAVASVSLDRRMTVQGTALGGGDTVA